MSREPTYDPIHPDYVSAQRAFVDRHFVDQALLSTPVRVSGAWSRRLFRIRPKQWGLRGDPWLWREISETLALSLEPDGPDDFEVLLMAAIEDLVGVDLRATGERQIHVPRYPAYGMSGGFIAVDKWLKDLVPLLVDRFLQSQG